MDWVPSRFRYDIPTSIRALSPRVACLPCLVVYWRCLGASLSGSISVLEFPRCVLGAQPELTTDLLQLGDERPYCWRNVFTSINLLRILNKLCKWKHSRIMVSRRRGRSRRTAGSGLFSRE